MHRFQHVFHLFFLNEFYKMKFILWLKGNLFIARFLKCSLTEMTAAGLRLRCSNAKKCLETDLGVHFCYSLCIREIFVQQHFSITQLLWKYYFRKSFFNLHFSNQQTNKVISLLVQESTHKFNISLKGKLRLLREFSWLQIKELWNKLLVKLGTYLIHKPQHWVH